MTTSRANKKHPKQNQVLKKYAGPGLFLRRIRDGKSELKTIRKNEEILQQLNIEDAADLKVKFLQDIQDNSMPQFEDFRFRPSTFLREGIPIDVFQGHIDGFGLIIDPEIALAVFFYKKNVYSAAIANGKKDYDFDRPYRIHDVESQAELLEKELELNQSRNGFCYENYNEVYGKNLLPRTEVLLHPPRHAIIGLELSVNSNIRKACRFRNTLQKTTKNEISFFQYHIELGKFVLIPETVIQDCLTGKTKIKDYISPHPSFPDRYTEHLSDIKCSLKRKAPSVKAPITYRFTVTSNTNPKDKLRCKAYIKDGIPLIKDDKNRIYNDENGFIPRVALSHQLAKLQQCNDLFKNKNIRDHLHRLGVKNIMLKSVTCKRSYGQFAWKNYFVLSYKPLRLDVDARPILEAIGYNSYLWKWEHMPLKEGRMEIRLSVLQSLDSIANKLIALSEPTKEEAVYKKLRVK